MTAKEADIMEIKRINGVLSAYQTVKKNAAPKTETAASVRNTDRVEFGFETALQAAKNGIAAAVRADAAPQELEQAQQTLDNGVEANDLASYILFG